MASLKVAVVMLICMAVVAAPMAQAKTGSCYCGPQEETCQNPGECSPVPACCAQESGDWAKLYVTA